MISHKLDSPKGLNFWVGTTEMSYIQSAATIEDLPGCMMTLIEGDGDGVPPIAMRMNSGKMASDHQIAKMRGIQKVASRRQAVIQRLRKKVKEAGVKKVEDSTA